MQQEQLHPQQNEAKSVEESPSMPECCGTGCTVCVLDYPEYFSEQKSESEMLAMLEAIEEAQWRAQRQAQQMVANQDGDAQ